MDSMTSPSARCSRSAGEPGIDADDGGVAIALGNGDADLGHAGGGAILVDLVFGRREIAGIGIERLQQAVQSAGGHRVDVGIGDVVALDSLEDLGIDVHLAVGAILLAAGVNAEHAELAQREAEAESGKNGCSENEGQSLKKSGHTHHR